MLRCNEPAESALRVNTLVADVVEVCEEPAIYQIPEGIVLEGSFDAHGSSLFERGAIMPQSRGSMLVSRMLDPNRRERVLDLCAAPGAKTTHLAALMRSEGELVAVEQHGGRASALARTCARMRADCVRVRLVRISRSSGSYSCFLIARARTAFSSPSCAGLSLLCERAVSRLRCPSLATRRRR